MKLRPYQESAVESVFCYFGHQSGNPVIALPTGTGKSVVIARLLQMIFESWPSQRVMMLTHVKELIEQNYKKLLELWPTAPAGVFSAGLKRREHWAPITFAGIQSVAKRARLFGHIDLVVIDEAHLVSDKDTTTYQKFIAALKEANPKLKVVGLTATAYRLGQGLIIDGGLFTDICFDYTSMEKFNELLRDGYLAPVVPRRTDKKLETAGVQRRGGEFVHGQLSKAVDRDEITYATLLEARDYAKDRRSWLVFAVSVEHAEKCAECLNYIGVPATCVHSKISAGERDERISAFKRGEYRAIVNNNILTTGFDHPPIDCIVMLRPTCSPGLWVQMLGRGTRPSEGKTNCLVLDFARNTERLGPINDPVIPRRRGSGGGGAAPCRLCTQCGYYSHASKKNCDWCGVEFPQQVKFAPGASEGELIRNEQPEIHVYPVNHMSVQKHVKKKAKNAPPSLRVHYRSGINRYTTHVCLEHENYAGKRAREWWRAHVRGASTLTGAIDAPDTCDEALGLLDHLRVPTHIRVWTNKQYPEIMDYDWSGTAFGEEEKHDPRQVSHPKREGRSHTHAPEILSNLLPPEWKG